MLKYTSGLTALLNFGFSVLSLSDEKSMSPVVLMSGESDQMLVLGNTEPKPALLTAS